MHRTLLFAAALAAASLAQAQQPLPAPSSPELREELKGLNERVKELEGRVQDAEAAAAQAANRPQAQNALNPAVSAILNGVYANLSRNPASYRISGFVPTMGEVAPPPRGFSLGESELGLAANIDPRFRGALIAAISPDDDTVGVEEGYIETIGPSRGVTVKAGISPMRRSP
jgi:hypothetical protein